ncbi:response regulator transcription factor [Rhizobium sp. SSA_523]|uniref:response regulator n=1 Tax=Rhizobium sp. SSA_523 TaxID=2952477 RepID=UPI002090F93D|nr:response regulator transcription factor [Rhizobium sp. SSA_523]MCO5731348.1 response regulator transcription factor [Rhizobium sp. SSA_523]WKC22122.1 response regulator transcription factor [Rhizobium sp. SSA_523]
MGAPLSIAVVDDHPLFREGVGRSLEERGCSIIAEGASADEAVRIVADYEPDILLLDVSLPGGGLRALEEIRERQPEQKVVMLTVSEQSDDVLQALKLGAQGYVLKGIGSAALADVLATVSSGARYVAPSLSADLLARRAEVKQAGERPQPDTSGLTEREQDVMIHLSQGLSNKMIARKLGLQEKTIKHHITRIFDKLSVSNRTEAALVWRQRHPEPPAIAALAPSAPRTLTI